jgi:flagellar basal-body rod protein FlgG
MNTPGFKESQAVARSFPEMLIVLMQSEQKGGNMRIGRLNTGVFAEEAVPVYVQGALRETGNPFDFALVSDIQTEGLAFIGGKAYSAEGERVPQPQAFFAVENAEGEVRYTRNGKFRVNEAGELVTSEGYRVLGRDGQPIVLFDAETQQPVVNIQVNALGQIANASTGQALTTAGGEPVQLLIARVDNPERLIPEGYALFRLGEGEEDGAVPIGPGDNAEVRQGYIETSNVDPTRAMVDMMTAARMYEANQKVVQAYDKSMEKAVNEVGRV